MHADDVIEQCEGRVLGVCGDWDVARDRVVGKCSEQFRVAGRSSKLERADTQMARRHPREHRARNPSATAVDLALERLAGGDDGQHPGGRDTECVHRLAHHVLAQHRAEGGAAVATSCERGAARPLQMQVSPCAVISDDLAEQQRPAVAEAWRVPAELVPGICLGDGDDALRCGVPGEHREAAWRSQRLDIEPELSRQRLVHDHQFRLGDGIGVPRLVQPDQLLSERIVELEHGSCSTGHSASLGTSCRPELQLR